jgi:hypothetical protein
MNSDLQLHSPHASSHPLIEVGTNLLRDRSNVKFESGEQPRNWQVIWNIIACEQTLKISCGTPCQTTAAILERPPYAETVVSPAFSPLENSIHLNSRSTVAKGSRRWKANKRDRVGLGFFQHTLNRQCDQEMKHGDSFRGLSC